MSQKPTHLPTAQAMSKTFKALKNTNGRQWYKSTSPFNLEPFKLHCLLDV